MEKWGLASDRLDATSYLHYRASPLPPLLPKSAGCSEGRAPSDPLPPAVAAGSLPPYSLPPSANARPTGRAPGPNVGRRLAAPGRLREGTGRRNWHRHPTGHRLAWQGSGALLVGPLGELGSAQQGDIVKMSRGMLPYNAKSMQPGEQAARDRPQPAAQPNRRRRRFAPSSPTPPCFVARIPRHSRFKSSWCLGVKCGT